MKKNTHSVSVSFAGTVILSVLLQSAPLAAAAPAAGNTSIEIKTDGTKVIKDNDGSLIEVHPDGSKLVKKPDGTLIEIRADGSKTIKTPEGAQIEIRKGG